MNILITGGAGFIGSNLADKLLEFKFNNNEENKIIVVDNFSNYYPVEQKRQNVAHNLNKLNYELFENDICDDVFLEELFSKNEIDIVIHLAGCAGVRPSIEEPLKYVKTNIEATVNILEKMKKYNVKKIVFASSSSVYGNCEDEKFSESIKTQNQISPYAVTKSACEQFLYTYSYLYKINAVALRFFTVFGPRQRPDLAICKFIDLIKQNKPIPVFGDGSTMRDYTYIDDIIDGIIKAVSFIDSTDSKRDFVYEIFNFGAANPITLNEMIKTIEKELNKRAIVEYLPMQKGDVFKTSSDISHAQKLLGYFPKTTFSEGIRKFIQWKNNQHQ